MVHSVNSVKLSARLSILAASTVEFACLPACLACFVASVPSRSPSAADIDPLLPLFSLSNLYTLNSYSRARTPVYTYTHIENHLDVLPFSFNQPYLTFVCFVGGVRVIALSRFTRLLSLIHSSLPITLVFSLNRFCQIRNFIISFFGHFTSFHILLLSFNLFPL